MRRMLPAAFALTVVAIGAGAAPANAQFISGPDDSPPPQSVELSVIVRPAGNANISGHGAVVRGVAQCVVITAAHVLAGAADAEWSDPTHDLPSTYHSASAQFLDDAMDTAILVPVRPIQNCTPLPETQSVSNTLREATNATVIEATEGGAVNQLEGKIVGRSPGEFALVTDFEARPGLSGAPVIINGQPVGIVLGGPSGDGQTICRIEFPRPMPFRPGHELCVRRIDFVANFADGRFLRQTVSSMPAGDGSDGVDGNRLFWEGAGLDLMGRQRSARLRFEQAGRQGSAAGWLQFASMQQDGEGGPRDAAAASTLTSKYLPVLFTQAEGSPAAVLTLLGMLHKGVLSPGDAERAKGAIVRGYQALGRQAAAGDATAATWQIILRLGDLDNTAAARSLAHRIGAPDKPASFASLLGNGCVDMMCYRRQLAALLRDSISAMEQGSDIAALLLGVTSTSLLPLVDAGSVAIPECGLLRSLDARNPVRNAAIASCTVVRRNIALRQLSPLAFDEGQDYQIWKAALADGYFSLKTDRLSVLAAGNPNAATELMASQRVARDEELNRDAGLALVQHALASGPVTPQDINALIAYVDGSSPKADDESRADALGTLFAAELLYGYPGSRDAVDATIRKIHELDARTITAAIEAVSRTGGYWTLEQRKDAPGFMTSYVDLMIFAASKGSAGAIAGLIGIEKIQPSALRYAPYSQLHPYLQAAAREDAIGMAEIICLAESQDKFAGSVHDAAIRFCEAALDSGVAQVAEPLRWIHAADGKAEAARSAFARGEALGATDVLWGVLNDDRVDGGTAIAAPAGMARRPGTDTRDKAAIAMALVARGHAEAADALMFHMINGDFPWQPSNFQYAARFLVRSGVVFECLRGTAEATACQLTGLGGKLLGDYGGAVPDSHLAIVSEDKYQTLVAALAASGVGIRSRVVSRATAPPPAPRTSF